MRNKIKKIIYLTGIFDLLFYIFRIFPVKKNKVLFESSAGNSFGDSPKAIYNLLKNNKELELVWVVNNQKKDLFPNNIKTVNRDSIKYIYEHVTAKVWISNTRKAGFVRKRKKQFYLQTWHSPLRLKMVEKDAINSLSKQIIKNSINDAKMTDLMISGCEFSKKMYQNSFWYNGNVEMTGTPRCDIFFNEEEVMKVKKKICELYKFDINNKIILYAPTFRNNGSSYFQLPNFNQVSGDFLCLYRFHHNSSRKNEKIENAINVTDYLDMQELLLCADILITDYSSSMFDMLIAKKKCILYVPDLIEYSENERGLYFDINNLPFPKVYNNQELIEQINKFDEKEYNFKINEFSKEIGLKEEGNATEKVCKILEDVIYEKI